MRENDFYIYDKKGVKIAIIDFASYLNKNLPKDKKYMVFQVVIACAVACALFYRILHSVELTDETYGIAEIYNYSFGKRPFVDVWDPHTGWFLYIPFLNLFGLLSPQLEGIVLYFRIIYLVLTFVIGYLTYRISSRNIPLAAVVGCLGYVSFSVPQMGYNPVVSFLLILEFGVLYAYKIKQQLHLSFLAGVISGLACLFYPTVAVMAILTCLVVWKMSKQEHRKATSLYAIGVAVVGIGFFLWLFIGANGNINTLLDGFKATISTPHEQNKGAINFNFLKITFFDRLNKFYSLRRTIVWVVFFLASFVIRFRNYSLERKSKYGLMAWFAFIIIAGIQIMTDDTVLPISRGGYICYTVLVSTILFSAIQWRSVNRISVLPIGMAIVWILTYCLTSDNKNLFHGMDAAGNIIMFAGCFVGTTIKINTGNDGKKTLYWFNAIIPLATLFFSIVCFYGYVYRDAPVSELRTRVDSGIYKGLYTTRNNADYVAKVEAGLSTFLMKEDETVFTVNNIPYMYLMMKRKPLCPQTWDAQFLARGYTSAEPVLSYFDYIGEKPSVIIANNHLFPTLFDNKAIEIWGFIKQYYDEVTVLDYGRKGAIKIWRLKDLKS